MLDFVSMGWVILFFAFLTGVFTKSADLFVEHGYKTSTAVKILLGILWGVCGSAVVLGSDLVGAFYFGILLSWIFRYKLDYYNHGIGGVIILATLFYTQPTGFLVNLVLWPTFVLFTLFGLLSREAKLKHKLSWIQKFNVYSFVYLGILSFYFPAVWLVWFASLSNVIGYHGVNWYFSKYVKKSS